MARLIGALCSLLLLSQHRILPLIFTFVFLVSPVQVWSGVQVVLGDSFLDCLLGFLHDFWRCLGVPQRQSKHLILALVRLLAGVGDVDVLVVRVEYAVWSPLSFAAHRCLAGLLWAFAAVV